MRKKEFNEGIGQTMSADAEPVVEEDEQAEPRPAAEAMDESAPMDDGVEQNDAEMPGEEAAGNRNPKRKQTVAQP